MARTIAVETHWTGLWGEKIRVDNDYYQVDQNGRTECSEIHAAQLCTTSGWRYCEAPVAASKTKVVVLDVPEVTAAEAPVNPEKAPKTKKPKADKEVPDVGRD